MCCMTNGDPWSVKQHETQGTGKTDIGHRVAAKKNVSIVVIRFWLTLSFILYGYFKKFAWAKTLLLERETILERETTLQHDMACEICFHFLLEEGWNFCAQKSIIKAGNIKFHDLINAPRIPQSP